MIVQFVILFFVLCSVGFLGENPGMLGFALQVTGTPLPHLTGLVIINLLANNALHIQSLNELDKKAKANGRQ
jgi:hypothetical protein